MLVLFHCKASTLLCQLQYKYLVLLMVLSPFLPPLPHSCGIALDCWMIPIHRDLLESGIHQPLLFINSFSFQWPDNVRRMMKLTHPPQYTGASACTILTLKLVNQSIKIQFSTIIITGVLCIPTRVTFRLSPPSLRRS